MINIGLIPRYIREDGKYIGAISKEHLKEGLEAKVRFRENGNEHVLDGKVVSCAPVNDYYSCLVELNQPAPKRVIDLYCFAEKWEIAVGEVSKNQLKIYSDNVFIREIPFDIKYKLDKKTSPIPLKGEIFLEDSPGKSGYKYVFWLKLEKELSEEDYQNLKKVDIDDVTNYFL